jgi:LPXTG-site transpeptidase (sortase) family protein
VSAFLWKDGVTPGEPGQAVLNGHTAVKREAVFNKTHLLTAGDMATTVAGDWTCNWEVSSNKAHPPGWFTKQRMNKLYDSNGPPRLVFITCWKFIGVSDDGEVRFRKRMVTELKMLDCS